MFVGVAPDYAFLAEQRGFADEAEKARAANPAKMADVILEHGWDGEWFLRAYDFFGNKVGSKDNEESQIFIEPQGFCVMAGVGVEGGQAKKALDSVKERLDTQVRHRPQQPRLLRVPRGARRDLLVPARLQGERRHLLPQQPVGDHRRDR